MKRSDGKIKRVEVHLFEEKGEKIAVIRCPRISNCNPRECSVRKKYSERGYRIACLNPLFYCRKDVEKVKDEMLREGYL